MTRNQAHGKRFEDFIKASGRFDGSADKGRSPTSGFDIEARFDRECGLPTSVKSTGSDIVSLSDARRFVSLSVPYRMLVGRYWQVGARKEFREVHEFILPAEATRRLIGSLTQATVDSFHNGLLAFPAGQHRQARSWARAQKQLLAGVETCLVLNPKIDSKSQRRLQCSVRLSTLIEIAGVYGKYQLHTESIGATVLPIIQNSPRRARA